MGLKSVVEAFKLMTKVFNLSQVLYVGHLLGDLAEHLPILHEYGVQRRILTSDNLLDDMLIIGNIPFLHLLAAVSSLQDVKTTLHGYQFQLREQID